MTVVEKWAGLDGRWVGTRTGDRQWRTIALDADVGRHALATLPQEVRDTWGGRYPLTYEFTIPAGQGTLTCDVRDGTDNRWTRLRTLDRTDLFTGEEGVRWADGKAYVSVAFSTRTLNREIRFRTAASELASATYDGICDYYDDRACPVVMTWDDWNGNPDWHERFLACGEAHAERGLVYSPAINAGGHWEATVFGESGFPALSGAQWRDIQDLIDTGFCEPSNHGWQHRNPSTGGYPATTEIEDGAADILANLTMPWQNRTADAQFILGWIEPYGQTNSGLQAILATNGHINQRTWTSYGVQTWRTFQETIDVYDRQIAVNLDSESDDGTYTAAISTLATCRGDGSICMYGGHPWRYGQTDAGTFVWSNPSDPIYGFLDAISGYEDVWYVGWGHLYLYRREAETVTVTT